MTPDAILNAAQAAGLGVNIIGDFFANNAAKQGLQIQQGQNNLRMQQEQLASTQQAQIATQNLRSNLATQAVLAATRGVRSGVGNALAAQNQSVGNYNTNISNINLNQKMRNYEYNLENGLAQQKYLGDKTQRAVKTATNALDTISVNEWIRGRNGSPLGKSTETNVYG